MQLLRHVDKDNCYAIGKVKGQRTGVGAPVGQVAEYRIGVVHPVDLPDRGASRRNCPELGSRRGNQQLIYREKGDS